VIGARGENVTRQQRVDRRHPSMQRGICAPCRRIEFLHHRAVFGQHDGELVRILISSALTMYGPTGANESRDFIW